MTTPNTLEELRAALQRLADEHYAAAEDITGRVAIGEKAMRGTFVRRLLALLPPVPEPIKPGDRVRHVWDGTTGEVLDQVVVRWDAGVGLELVLVDDLTRIPDAELLPAEAEPEWRESTDPDELERAMQDGRQVEVSLNGKTWRPTLYRTADGFRRYTEAGNRYRIGPKAAD